MSVSSETVAADAFQLCPVSPRWAEADPESAPGEHIRADDIDFAPGERAIGEKGAFRERL